MAQRRQRTRITKRIELPSGKAVEVSMPAPADPLGQAAPEPSRERSGAGAGSKRAQGASRPDLCPACASTLVYPVDWRSAPDERWSVDLRCPNCERTDTVTLGQPEAERFDEELERGSEALVRDLARLTKANMTEHAERFVAALEIDAIQPIDF